jgi:hypothetical protein
MLLIAVSVTDNATSPLANIEKTFDELPPGQHATNTIPIKYMGGNFIIHAKAKAMRGSIINCPIIPIITARGLRATSVKDFLFKSVPNKNIKTIKMGITIKIVFIF